MLLSKSRNLRLKPLGVGGGREKENLAPSLEEEEGRGRKKGEGTSTTATIEMEARWSDIFALSRFDSEHRVHSTSPILGL